MNIDEELIKSISFNEDSFKNGKKLATTKSYENLKITEDGTLLYGECKGSGKNPYICSVDFSDTENPIGRCTCPSRQIPCKHVTGLLISKYNGETFEISDVPQDIILKREKIQKKKENITKEPKEKTEKSIKSQSTKEIKKIQKQLEGIQNAKTILENILLDGLAALDVKKIKEYEQQIKNLGNYYIGGIQTAFLEFATILKADKEQFNQSIDKINYINTLLLRGEEYLESKKENPLIRNTTTQIEEQIGHIWKKTELKELGLVKENRKLIEISFFRETNIAKKEVEEISCCLDLTDGKIYKKMNLRPMKALKYVKEEDSTTKIINVEELVLYPGEINQRINFEGIPNIQRTNEDYIKCISLSNTNYENTIKEVKNIIKNPLSTKSPMYLLKFSKIVIGEKLFLVNNEGEELMLSNDICKIKTIYCDEIKNSAVLVKFSTNLESRELQGEILTFITPNGILNII